MKSSLLLLAAVLLLSSPALGHGGRYRGPMGEVPPGQRDPKDPVPPGGLPVIIPPDVPRMGPDSVSRPRPVDFEHWLFWWHHNKDDILSQHVARRGDTGRPLSWEMIDRVILPALKRVAATPDIHPDIIAGALIAEARAGGRTGFRERLFALAHRKNGADKIVRESAVLALALAGDRTEAARDLLIGIADDRDDQHRIRCFALVALGLLRDTSPEVVDCILRRLDGKERTPDVPMAAFLAAGLVGARERVPEMMGWLDTRTIGSHRLPDLARAAIVAALGRIGDPAPLEAIAKTLRRKGTLTRRATAIALGQLVPRLREEDQLIQVAKIEKLRRHEKDSNAENYLTMSLGRTGAADGVPGGVREACIKVLTQDDLSRREQSWQSLGLGLIGFGEEVAAPEELRLRLAEFPRQRLEKLKGDKKLIAAHAIALGMLGDDRQETVDLLVRILRDRGQERKLRGAAAVALGMLRHPDGVEPILRAIREREDRDLRVDTVLAAGLIGDPRFVEPIVKVMRDRKASQFVLGSCALALGWIGDRSAVRPLLVILEPGNPYGEYPDLTRALVTVALGRIAMRGESDPLDRISRDLNYRASTMFLDELLTIL